MAESDRRRLLERALALPDANAEDFAGGRRPPGGAEPGHLKIVNDTGLRTKLIASRIAEGLQSPKGPQRIKSILRIYPDFNAPPKSGNGKAPRAAARTAAAQPSARTLPTVDEMERLIARLREAEAEAGRDLTAEIDARIERLKRELMERSGDAFEDAYRELGQALEAKRAIRAHVRAEAFKRVEADTSFAPRAHLRYLARA